MAEPGALRRSSIAGVIALLVVGAAAVTAQAALGQALSPANVIVEDFPAVNLDGTAKTTSVVVVAAGPYFTDGATVKIVSAAPGSSGTFNFSQGGPLTLSLPASAYARAYRSDVTVGVASGP